MGVREGAGGRHRHRHQETGSGLSPEGLGHADRDRRGDDRGSRTLLARFDKVHAWDRPFRKRQYRPGPGFRPSVAESSRFGDSAGSRRRLSRAEPRRIIETEKHDHTGPSIRL